MVSLRALRRPQHKILVPVLCLSLSLWLLYSLAATAVSAGRSIPTFRGASGTRTRSTRGNEQEQQPLSPDVVDPRDSASAGAGHSRLQQRPQPVVHGSEPEFPNVPITIRLPTDDGSHITAEEVEQYLTSIWDLGDTRFWRTECDTQMGLPRRYEILRDLARGHTTSRVKYFFALNLFQVRSLLPRLMGTLVQVLKQLGPEKCAISVVEGRSDDGTYAILSALKEKTETLGARFHLSQSDLNPHGEGVDRIAILSELRNLAIEPLVLESKKNATGPPTYNDDTIVVFVNDIAVCTEDVYELLFQHVFQSAHQTCGMDWVYGGDLFYDSWVSRSMSGDLFFEIPQDTTFAYGGNMFWDHPLTKEKFKNNQPFQVYSCWGGIVTLSSAPFISGQIEIRDSSEGECYAGEPINLAKDLWRLGYGKILTVPTVNVGYNSLETSRIKKRRGWVHTSVDVDKTEAEWKGTQLVEWRQRPPGQVKCLPSWGVISWTDP